MMVVRRGEQLRTYGIGPDGRLSPVEMMGWVSSVFMMLYKLAEGDDLQQSMALASIQQEWIDMLKTLLKPKDAARILMESAEDIAREICEGEEADDMPS